jgi:hypothetical protein
VTVKKMIGTTLLCDNGYAVVVAPGTSALDGLLTLLEEGYGSPRFAPDNPAIVAALESTQCVTWWSCTRAWKEANNREDFWFDDYWAEDGDGKRSIDVVWVNGDIYLLGENANRLDS